MKKLFYIGWLCLTLAACSREDLPGLSGKPASLILSINTLDSDVKTRADTPPNERRIFNLYLFVFNADGSIDYQQYNTFSSILNSKTLTIEELTCGSGKSVAAIANIGITNTIVNIPSAKLDAVTSRYDLETLIVDMKLRSLERGTNFLMSGFAENVTVSAGGATSAIVSMKRVDAKIRFNITTEMGVTFTPGDWRIVSLPYKISVMNQSLDLCSATDNCFDSGWAKFEGIGATFAFYSMEHILTPKTLIPPTGDHEKDYALREKQIKIPNESGNGVTNGDFVYAPVAGTYVEIRGNVAYNASANVEISADVIYTIHLGGVDNNVDDYNTLRNTDYTYNVKIVSVEKIEIEVDSNVGSENEQRPGGEGDVTAAHEIINLDAHNEIFGLILNQMQVDASLTWNVFTPFSEGSEADMPHDYKWVYFQINNKMPRVRRYNDDFRIYPGDHNIYDGDVDLDTYMSDIEGNKDKMLDVKQIVALLVESKKRHLAGESNLFDVDYNVKFTAFVNEYYYDTSPDGTSTAVVGLWKEFTNQQQRVMNILSNLKYSPDHESSKTNAVYSIRQHAIQTMYNRSYNEENYTAWGTEMIQDEVPVVFEITYPDARASFTNNPGNGRKNTIQSWSTWNSNPKKWEDYITLNTWLMRSDYDAAKYNCLRMNRDNNGDGTIDNSEVQWYLASINQLTDIWIGEWSYDPTARLYKKTTWEEQYFVSSTVYSRSGRKDNPQILWSAEGSSIGLLTGAAGNLGVNTPVYYRCVRNLGVSRSVDINTTPSELVEYSTTTRRMSLKRLDAQSIRGYYQAIEELPVHHEREAANKPYWAFTVGTVLVGGNTYTWKSLYDFIQSGARLCPDGYRIPNQRELSLMHSRIGNDGYWTLSNHFSRTRFQFDVDRPGFAVTQNNGVLFLLHANDEFGGVRCVKDYVE